MELSPDRDIKIEKPTIVVPKDANPEGFMFKAIYNQALGWQPQIKAGEYRIKSAEMGVKIAEAALLPSLSASAGISTNYSSTIQDFNNPDLTRVTQSLGKAVPVKIDGKDAFIQQ